jgi:hypothetical protein
MPSTTYVYVMLTAIIIGLLLFGQACGEKALGTAPVLAQQYLEALGATVEGNVVCRAGYFTARCEAMVHGKIVRIECGDVCRIARDGWLF